MPKRKAVTKPKSGSKWNSKKQKSYAFRLQKGITVGFPKTNMVKLRYVAPIALNAGVGSIGSAAFRLNSLFDPDYTGIGHQPNGFDQWSTFYNHYTVVSAQVKATFQINDGTTNSGGLMVGGIYISDDATYSADLGTILEQPMATRKFDSFSSSTKPITVKQGFSAKKFFNVTNVTDNTGRIGATVGANPSEVGFGVVFVGAASGVMDPPPTSVLVEIEFLTIFSEPKELAQS